MPTEPDRRAFLRTAGGVALAAAGLPVSGRATSPPPPRPPTKDGTGLAVLTGDGVTDLPDGAVARLGAPRMRVPGYVNKLQFAPRGTTLVAASGKEVRAWDPATGRVKFRFSYPNGASVDSGRLTNKDTFALVVRPDSGGKYQIRHYEFGTGKLLGQSPEFDRGNIRSTAFSPDGGLVAYSLTEGLSVCDGTTGAEKWRDTHAANSAAACQFFPDGARIALAVQGEIKVYDAATGKVTVTLTPPPAEAKEVAAGRGHDWVSDLVVSSGGQWLAAAVTDEGDVVSWWDVKSGKLQHTVKPAAKAIGFTPDGAALATFHGSRVTFWDASTGKQIRRIDVPRDDDVVLSPDGKILASAAGDAVILTDAATGKALDYSADPPGLPSTLRFAGGGRLVGRLENWGGWVEWDLKSGNARLIRPPDVSNLTPVSLTLDGRLALYIPHLPGAEHIEYQVRDVATGKSVRSGKAGSAGSFPADLTPDGNSLVAWDDESLVVTDMVKGTRRVMRKPGHGAGRMVALNPDGRSAALAVHLSNDRAAVEVFDLTTDRRSQAFEVEGEVGQMAFASDREFLAVAHDRPTSERFGQQGTATVFDLRTGKAVLKVPPDDHRSPQIALSVDGRVLARLESNDQIALWEVQGGGVRRKVSAKETVGALAFSPDGRTLAASVHGGPVFLWELYAVAKDMPAPDRGALDKIWLDLIGSDAAVAFDAIKRLAKFPDRSVPYLREKIAPLTPPDAATVNKLIADLDHREYRRREAAMRKLAEYGERCRGDLRKVLTSEPSPETRERVERLLSAEDRPSPETLRLLRAVEPIEVAGTPEAAKLLAHWATGAPGALFTTEAAAAVKRLSG